MNWNDFKTTLAGHPHKQLHFEYAEGERVPAGYHITEIKQAQITSVDCGGQKNEWTEVIVQLWQPDVISGDAMSTDKALSIIATVERVLPIADDVVVKIEFGNADFETRQMHSENIKITATEVLIRLVADKVQCKAHERGGTCGTSEPTTNGKRKIEMINLAQGGTCTPGGGCC